MNREVKSGMIIEMSSIPQLSAFKTPRQSIYGKVYQLKCQESR